MAASSTAILFYTFLELAMMKCTKKEITKLIIEETIPQCKVKPTVLRYKIIKSQSQNHKIEVIF